MYDIELAAMYVFDRNRRNIDALETANIHGPFLWSSAGATKGRNPANGAKIVFRGAGIPLVERQFFQGSENSKIAFFNNTMIERAPASAYRTITHSDVVEISVDLEPGFSAVTATAIRLFHDD
jgi:hypothetical protein